MLMNVSLRIFKVKFISKDSTQKTKCLTTNTWLVHLFWKKKPLKHYASIMCFSSEETSKVSVFVVTTFSLCADFVWAWTILWRFINVLFNMSPHNVSFKGNQKCCDRGSVKFELLSNLLAAFWRLNHLPS